MRGTALPHLAELRYFESKFGASKRLEDGLGPVNVARDSPGLPAMTAGHLAQRRIDG